MTKQRLLLIDDDEPTRKYIRRVAEDLGYEVFATESAREFIASYDANPPDLIITDIFMPQVDGIEILFLLSERHCRTPILLISGKSSEFLKSAQRLGEARRLSIAGTLGKPISPADLGLALLNATATAGSQPQHQPPIPGQEETSTTRQEVAGPPDGPVGHQPAEDSPTQVLNRTDNE